MTDLWKYLLIVAAGVAYYFAPRLVGLFRKSRPPSLIPLLTELHKAAAENGLDWSEALRPLVQQAWEAETRDDAAP